MILRSQFPPDYSCRLSSLDNQYLAFADSSTRCVPASTCFLRPNRLNFAHSSQQHSRTDHHVRVLPTMTWKWSSFICHLAVHGFSQVIIPKNIIIIYRHAPCCPYPDSAARTLARHCSSQMHPAALLKSVGLLQARVHGPIHVCCGVAARNFVGSFAPIHTTIATTTCYHRRPYEPIVTGEDSHLSGHSLGGNRP